MNILIFPAVDPVRLAAVQDAAGDVLLVINAGSQAEALAAMPRADAFFGKLTPELVAVATRLRWVQSPTASLEHYLFPALIEHPCTLTNMRGLFSDVIADHVLGYILCFARNIHRYIRQQRDRRWEPIGGEAGRTDFITGPGVLSTIDSAHRHLADQSIGIIGVGAIGREIARRAAAFGMTIRGVDPHPAPVEGITADIQPLESLDQLLAASDYVVVAAPHTPKTVKLINADTLARMRRDAVLINIGRGVIVDLAALTAALQAGTIGGAALDVFETEPLPQDHALWSCENVIITPHIAGCSPRVPERHLAVLTGNIRRFIRGEPLENVVNKREWY
jgi:phosphoglycerate dehydrogenase-like enzyme